MDLNFHRMIQNKISQDSEYQFFRFQVICPKVCSKIVWRFLNRLCLDLGFDPRNSQSKRLCFLAQRLDCFRKNFGCLRGYNRIVRKVKISDPDSSEGHSAAQLLLFWLFFDISFLHHFWHSSYYMIHASVETKIQNECKKNEITRIKDHRCGNKDMTFRSQCELHQVYECCER